MNNYDLLISKLDQFIRKFYINKLLRGLLYFVGLVLATFLIFNLLEYFFEFSMNVRKGLYFGFIGIAGISLLTWVLIPLFQFLKLGKVISHTQAASIIGDHFANVKDKLLNILQLKEQVASTNGDTSLIEASIDQKIDGIKLVPFTSAIDLGNNKKYVKYAAIPLLFLVGIIFMAPNLISTSTERIIQNDKEFEKEAPFQFFVENEKLEAVQFDDFKLNVRVEGEQLPKEAFVHINNFPYKLTQVDKNHYSYTFKRLQKDVDFFVEANGFPSETNTLSIIPKPIILSFAAKIDYPNYLGRKDEVLNNTGDLNIPAGTKVTWDFEAQNTDDISIKFAKADSSIVTNRKGEEFFNYSKRFYKSDDYKIYVSNKKLSKADSIAYNVSVTPDAYPSISAQEIKDTTNDARTIYFLGDAQDDYGLKNIFFHYTISPEKGAQRSQKIPVSQNLGKTSHRYTHNWSLDDLELNPGDQLSYYFEVWDNDGVNGSKNARSQTMNYRLKTIDEMEANAEENDDAIKSDMKESLKEAEKLKEEIKEIKEDLTKKKEMDWDDRNKVEKMLEKQKNLQEQIEQMQKEFEKNNDFKEEFKNESENIQEKKEQLEKLMEDILSDEMKEMLKKMEELMEEMESEEMMEQLEEMEMSNEQLERELDRMMELMKQLEMEQKMEETIDKLREMAEEQEDLAEETEQDNDGNLDEQEEKQEELNEEFEELKEDLEELEKMQEELDKDTENMEQNKEDAEKVQEDMEQSSDELEKQDSQKASEKQKDAAQKMQQMAAKMQQQMNEMKEEEAGEDIKAIRQLLENLIDMSMDQETVMDGFEATTTSNANYTSLVQDQYKLKDDFKIIEDSIVALSKRVPQIESFVIKELSVVEKNFQDGIDNLEDRKIDFATANQQYVMTSVNNLALMLSETMQQMQQQMMNSMPGSGSCDKPGGKGSGLPDMSKMQKALNEQLKQMQEGMGKPGGKKPGGKGGSGMSQQMAEAAAQQAAIRNALKKINEEKNKDGKGGLGDLEKLMEEMEQSEEDIVNKRITRELLERQQEIMGKLLEAEKAEQTRGEEEKREARQAQQKPKQIPPEIEEYLKQREAETELYKTVPPSLNPYYKSLVERYFQKISNK